MTSHASGLKRLIPVVKALVAIGLIAYLIWLVPFRDHLTLPQPSGESKVYPGEIVKSVGADPLIRTDSGEFRVTLGLDGSVLTVSDAQGQQLYAAPAQKQPGAPVAELGPGVISVVKNASIPLLIAALVMIFIATLVAMYRWYLLLNAADLSTTLPRVFSLTFIGAFFNNVMPGNTGGDLLKAYYIAKEHSARKTEAIITVLLDRVLGITGLALVAALAIPFNFDQYREVGIWIYGILGVLAAGSCVFFSRRIRRALGIERLIAALPFGDIFKKIDATLFIYRYRHKTVAVSLLLSMVVHTIIIIGIGLIGGAISIETPFLTYFAMVPIGLIVAALPIAPGGWGVQESAFVYFWSTQGVPPALALSLSMIYKIEQMLISLVGGICLAKQKDRVSTEEVERFAESDGGNDAGGPGRGPAGAK